MQHSFSISHYEEILDLVVDRYDALPFREWRHGGGRPRLFLRHDIDHSLRLALDLARVEARKGVRATYFVQLHSPLYSLACASGVELVRELQRLGHEVGLHYDTAYYATLGAAPREGLEGDLATLSMITRAPVRSISRHVPIDTPALADVTDLGLYEAYSDRFFKEIKYVADSTMSWREGCVCGLLREGRELQICIHPLWWVLEGETLSECMGQCARHEIGEYEAEVRSTLAYYEAVLANRPALDRRFAEKREQEA